MQPLPQKFPAQRGAVLIVGLVLLLVVTLIGVSALRTTALQERMTGNLRQTNIAFQAAEAGLQAGLAYIAKQTVAPVPQKSADSKVWPACPSAAADSPSSEAACTQRDTVITDWLSRRLASDQGVAYSAFSATPIPDVAGQPRIFITERVLRPPETTEALQGGGTYYYTVTAIGFGQTDNATAIVESTVARLYR